MVILPGGFSYGDYLRSGAIAKFSPIMNEVVSHAKKGGYVMGICNGFQILTESGLLEGALLHNNNQRFICKNVFLKPVSKSAAINKDLKYSATYKIPIAHGEGRFYAPDEMLKSIEDNDQVLFRYASHQGEVSDEFNPNGSLHNIAGITNKKKNVFGMMPHPERAADEQLNNLDGKAIFESILNHCS
jgi:phosphoribosylformylglycinamidine synthase